MKLLVCGNAPCLIDQLKDKDLNEYKVVRINDWQPIEGYNNKCDIWVCYPPNHLGEMESCYDFTPYIEANYPEIWVPHTWTKDIGLRVLKRNFHSLHAVPFHSLQAEFAPDCPTTGVLTIFMAMFYVQFKEPIHIAGFDFYQGDRDYYFKEGRAGTYGVHKPLKDKEWVERYINDGRLINL